MAGNIGIRGNGGERYYYIQADTGQSIAIGFDSATETFNLNASENPDVTPDEATSYVAIDPVTGEMVIQAGLGQLLTVNSDVKFAEAQYVNLTTVNGTTPYTVLDTDYYLRVKTTEDTYTIQLPNLPTTGRVVVVKDADGLASVANITVTTVSGSVNIDGATTFVMNTNWQSAQFVFNGAEWEVF